jgi:hypothetical protein
MHTELQIDDIALAVTRSGILRTARLRHEWFEYLGRPQQTIDRIQRSPSFADLFTFVEDIHDQYDALPFHRETDSIAVLPITTFDKWWTGLDFKVRNKIRKAQKTGVELRAVPLDDDLAKGVELIYNESPIRQGKKFWHYGKSAALIKQDLSSFPECSSFIGAYHHGELIGFMKLFEGKDVLRTVHIISKVSVRDKPVMDALIAKAVEIGEQKGISSLHYGSWSRGGLGAFKVKHGFQRVDLGRYFVPLSPRGKCLLKLNLHHRPQDYLPEKWVPAMLAFRAKWNSFRFGAPKRLAAGN